jgi:hypothetical protein
MCAALLCGVLCYSGEANLRAIAQLSLCDSLLVCLFGYGFIPIRRISSSDMPCRGSGTSVLIVFFLHFSTGQSDLQETSPHGNSDGMWTIVSAQFVHEILNMEIYGGVCNRQLIGNLLTAAAVSN